MRHGFQKAGIGKRLWFLTLFPASLILTSFAAADPAFAQWYAAGIYFRLSLAGNRLTGLIPFSLGEVLVCLLVLSIPVFLAAFVVGIIRKKGNRAGFALKFFVNLAVFASIVSFLFAIDCGINYYREPFAETCGLNVRPSTKAELEELCSSLSSDLNRLRPGLAADEHAVMKLRRGNLRQTAQEAAQAYNQMEREYPALRAGYSAPKLVYFSKLMSRCNITGVFFPFTFEANVNTDVPDNTIPVTMCHELTHLRGYMREDEANFVGYLVCRSSSDPDFQYSGDLLAFTYASNALFSEDPKAAGHIYSSLCAGVQRDLAYNSAYWKQFEGPVAKTSEQINDHYLKANSQTEGVKSYGKMVDLLLAEQRSGKQ